LERLKASPEEVETLAHDLLVGVTSFFRDPEVFEALRRKVFPDLVRRSTESEPIRIWIPGCSTGQEVYTVGMCLLEALDAAGLKRDFRIFATDLNGEALKHASRGEYTVSELQDVPKTLGTRYVEYRAGALSVNATLRRSVLFALHNLVKDPPFTRIDFLSCRNLIIYLKPDARQKVMNSLLTALKPDTGVLLLGKAESISAAERHFEEIDTNHKLYRRTDRVAPVNIASSVALVDPVRSVVSAEPLGRRSYAELRAAQDAKMLRVVLETSFEGERRSAALIDQGNRLLEVITDPQGIFRLRKGRPSDDLALLLTGPFSAALLSARSRLAEDADA
ncbi:MAG: protein-glutamate O-methyltransferase CheR, partial [Myxococcota bacterium]